MATVSLYKTKRGRHWQVQYTKPDGSRTRKRGFPTKAEAQAWISTTGLTPTTARRAIPTNCVPEFFFLPWVFLFHLAT